MTAVDIQISAIVHDGILVFEPKPIEFPKVSDIQSDSFKKSKGKITGMIENVFKQWLKFHPDDSVFTNPGTENQPFTLLKYRTVHTIDGLSVALTVEYENETYCLCCTDDMKLDFKKGECPIRIKDHHSDIIFFQQQFSAGDNSFKFESSLHPDYYLAVNEECGKCKLILQKSNGFNELERFNVV